MQATSVPSPRPWTRASLQREEWLRPFPRRCLDELEKTAQILERNPLHTYLLDPGDYPLQQIRGFMAEAKAVLDRGCGFVVLDRLPVRELGRERSKDLYWLLSSLIARPVAQAFKGTMLYDVRDLGLAQSAEVRGDLTREEFNWHTDFELEPGQIQYLANYHVAHRRSTYEDFDDDEEKRHLVRIFLRDFGQRSFDG